MSRTLFLKNFMVWILLTFLWSFPSLAESGDILLPAPAPSFHMDLKQALQLRQSTRTFQATPLTPEALSLLLWSANGINRPDGKRTAPSAYNTQCIRIYLADDQALFLYDAKSHILRRVLEKNLKGLIAPANSYAAKAPVILLLTADISGFPNGEDRTGKINLANASAGFVGQNIYLAAAALRVGTIFAAGLDALAVKRELSLAENEIPLAVMPVGYPEAAPLK